MKSNSLDNAIKRAKELDSYLITVTTKDKTKKENDLNHDIFTQEFPVKEIVSSLDASVRSLDITPPQITPVVKPPKVYKDRKPLKIAILTHFHKMPESFSPARAVRNQVKMLQQYGHEVVFFTTEGSTAEVGCEMRNLVPRFKREKWVVNEEAKQKFIDVLREQLTSDFDLAISHDFYIDDCITYREAIRECGVPIKWLHWARSGVGKPLDFTMDNARYVYMNYADAGNFAKSIGVSSSKIRIVFNEKDPSLLYSWDSTSKMISDKMRLWEKDIIQVYGICTTRMEDKGLNSIIHMMGILKSIGQKVALVVCNANGRKKVEEIKNRIEFAKHHGLTEDDIVFTSFLANDEHQIESEVKNKVVSDLMQVANLFMFPTMAEVCSNLLLEASMAKNLIVINEDLPSLRDFVNDNAVLKYPWTSHKSLHFQGRNEESLTKLAKQIIGQLRSNKADLQFRHVWKHHNLESIYRDMLEPILYE